MRFSSQKAKITTRDSAVARNDIDFSADLVIPAIPAGAILQAEWTPAVLTPAVTSAVTLKFKSAGRVKLGGKLSVVFPLAGAATTYANSYDQTMGASPAVSVTSPAGLGFSAGWDVSVTTLTLTLTTGELVPDQLVTVSIAAVTSPPSVRGALSSVLGTLTEVATDLTIDQGTVTTSQLLAGALASSTLETMFTTTGALSPTFSIGFTTVGIVPAEGAFEIEFPAVFAGLFTAYDTKSSAGAIKGSTFDIGTVTGPDGTFSMSRVAGEQKFTVSRAGGTAFAAGAVMLNFQDLLVPAPIQYTGNFKVRTYTGGANKGIIDQDEAVPGFTITDVPAITAVNVAAGDSDNLLCAGGQTLTITGTDFGQLNKGTVSAYYGTNAQPEATTTIGYELTSCKVTVASTTIECTTSVGVGAGHLLRLTIGAGVFSPFSTATVSYAKPSISSITPGSGTTLNALLAAGGEDVTITGLNFGPLHDAGGQVGKPYTTEPPRPNQFVVTYQNDQLTDLAGLEYTPTTQQTRTIAADWPSLCRMTVADTKIVCKTMSGVGSAHKWRVSAGGQRSDINAALATSYAVPIISSFDSGALALSTDGTVVATVTGTNFGPVDATNTVQAQYQNTALGGLAGSLFQAQSCTVKSDTQMDCLSAVGVGLEHKWVVTVGAQVSAQSTAYTSYRTPSVSSILMYDKLGQSEMFLGTDGTSSVTIVGNDFGPVKDTNIGITAHYQNTALTELAGLPFNLTGVCSVVLDHVHIRCTATAAGVGKEHRWSVVVGTQLGAKSTATTSYKVPRITQIEEVTVNALSGEEQRVSSQIQTKGGNLLEIQGYNFGPTSSNAQALYPAHTVSNPVAAWFQTKPANLVTLSTNMAGDGHSFNGVAITSSMAALQYFLLDCNITNDVLRPQKMQCLTPPGVGSQFVLTLKIGHVESASDDFDNGVITFQYVAPTVTQIQPAIVGTSANVPATLTGNNFGPKNDTNYVSADFSLHRAFGCKHQSTDVEVFGCKDCADSCFLEHRRNIATSCTVTVADTEMQCTLPPGVGKNLEWAPIVGWQRGNTVGSNRISYVVPAIASLGTARGLSSLQTRGDDVMTLAGTNFGPVHKHNRILASYSNNDTGKLHTFGFDAASCAVTTNDVEVQCRSAPGVGTNLHWEIDVGGQLSAVSEPHTNYSVPQIDYLSPSNGPTVGDTNVTIHGTNLGASVLFVVQPNISRGVTVGLAATDAAILFHDHEKMVIRMPAHPNAIAAAVRVSSGAQTTNSRDFANYKPLALSPLFGPIHGTTNVTLRGRGFVDPPNATIRVRFGGPGTAVYDATFVDSETISWATQSVATGTETQTPYISLNNQTWTNFTSDFTYYDPPSIGSLFPVLGPVMGNTTVTVSGSFFNTSRFRAMLTNSSCVGSVGCSKIVNCTLQAVADQTKTSTGSATCAVPSSFSYSDAVPSPFATPGFSTLEISVDTTDTVADLFTGNKKPYFYHKMNYTAHGPYPKIAPLAGSSFQYLIIDPDDLRGTVALQDINVRGFLGEEVMAAASREDHRIVSVHNLKNAVPLHDFVVAVTFDSTTAVAKGTLSSSCTDLRMWDADYYSELDVWVRPRTCNTTQTVVYVKVPQMRANASQELLMSYGHKATKQNGNATFNRDSAAHSSSFSNGLFESFAGAAWDGTTSDCVSAQAGKECPLWVLPIVRGGATKGQMMDFSQSVAGDRVLRIKHLLDGATFLNPRTSPYFKKYIKSRAKFKDDIAAESSWVRPEVGGQQFMYISTNDEALLLPPPDQAAATGVASDTVFSPETATMLWTRDTFSNYTLRMWGMDAHGVRFSASKVCTLANGTELSVSIRVVRSGIALQVNDCTVSMENTYHSPIKSPLPNGAVHKNCSKSWKSVAGKSTLPTPSYKSTYQAFVAHDTAIRHAPAFTRIRNFALFVGAFFGNQTLPTASLSPAPLFTYLFVRPALPDAAREPTTVIQPDVNYWRLSFESKRRSMENNVLRVAWNGEWNDTKQFTEPEGAPMLLFSQSALANANVVPNRSIANLRATFNVSTTAGMADLNAGMPREYQEVFARTHGLRCSSGLDICRATESCARQLEKLRLCGGNVGCLASAMQTFMDLNLTDASIEADVFALLNTPEQCAVDMDCLRYHSLDNPCMQSGIVGYNCFISAARVGKCNANAHCFYGLKQCSGLTNPACPSTVRADKLRSLLSGISRCTGSSSFAVRLQSTVMFCTPPYLNSALCEYLPPASTASSLVPAKAIQANVAFNGIDFLPLPGAMISMYNARFIATTAFAGPLNGNTLMEFDVELSGFQTGHSLTGQSLYFNGPTGAAFKATGVDVTQGSTDCDDTSAVGCERRTVQFRVPAREGIDAMVYGSYASSVIGLTLTANTTNTTSMAQDMLVALKRMHGCEDTTPPINMQLCNLPLHNATAEVDYLASDRPKTEVICSELEPGCCSWGHLGEDFHKPLNKSKVKLTLEASGLIEDMLLLQTSVSKAAAILYAAPSEYLNPMRWCTLRPGHTVASDPFVKRKLDDTPNAATNATDGCPPNSAINPELCPSNRAVVKRLLSAATRPYETQAQTAVYACYRSPALLKATVDGVSEHVPGSCLTSQAILAASTLMPVIKVGLHSLSMTLVDGIRVDTGQQFQFYDNLKVFDGLPKPTSTPSEVSATTSSIVTYSGPGDQLHLSMQPAVRLTAPGQVTHLSGSAAVLNPELRDGQSEVPYTALALDNGQTYATAPRLLAASQKFQSLYLPEEDAPFSVVLSGESYAGLLLKFVRTSVAEVKTNLYDLHIRYTTFPNRTKLKLCSPSSAELAHNEISAPVPSVNLTTIFGPGVITATRIEQGMQAVDGECSGASFCRYSWVSLPLLQPLVWPTGHSLLLEIEYRTAVGLKSTRDFNLGLSRLMSPTADRTVWNISTAETTKTPVLGYTKPLFDSRGRDASVLGHFVPQIRLRTNAVKLTAPMTGAVGLFSMDIAPNSEQFVGRWTQLKKQTNAGIKAAVQLNGLTKSAFGREEQAHFSEAMFASVYAQQLTDTSFPADGLVKLQDVKITRISEIGSGAGAGGRRLAVAVPALYVEIKVSTAERSGSHNQNAKSLANAIVPAQSGGVPPFMLEAKKRSTAFTASTAAPVKVVEEVEVTSVVEVTNATEFGELLTDDKQAFASSPFRNPVAFTIFKQKGILVGAPDPASGPVSWLTRDGVVQKTEVRIPLTGADGVITNGTVVTVRWYVDGSTENFADSIGVTAIDNRTIVTKAPDMTGLMSSSKIKSVGYMQTEIKISFNYHEGGNAWTKDTNSFSFYMVPEIYGLRVISSETPQYNAPEDLDPCKLIGSAGAEQEYALDADGNQLLDASRERVRLRGEVVNAATRQCALPAMKSIQYAANISMGPTTRLDGKLSAAAIGGYPYKGYNRAPQSGKNPTDFAGCCEFNVNGTATKCGAGPCNQVYVYINASNVWYRKNKLVCRFATGETGVGAIPYLYRAAAKITHSKFIFGLSEIICPVPPLSSGSALHAVDFSVNAGVTDEDHAKWNDGTTPIKIEAMPCPTGYVAPLPSMTCDKCTPGKYQVNPTKCEACDLGEYQDLGGQLSCKKCPKYSSTAGLRGTSSLASCSCDAGYYTENGADNKDDCLPCPSKDAVCLGGINLPFAKEGYVNHATLPGASGWAAGMNATWDMQRCSPPTACPGGMGNQICGVGTNYKCSPCSQGYTGFMCSKCAAEHYRLSHYCVACPTQDFIIGLFYLQIALYLLAVLLFCNDKFFEYVSKVASIQIFIRFLQVTFLLCFYELAWAGGAKKQWVTDEYGALDVKKSADTEVHAMEWIGIYKLASHLMPVFFFPSFGQTAGLDCVTDHWAAGKTVESVVAFGVPSLVLAIKWASWASKYRPQLLLESYYRIMRFIEGLTIGGRGKSNASHSHAHASGPKAEKLGDKQRDRILAMAVGIWVMMTPYIMREILTAITCTADTVGAACVATTDSQNRLLALVMLSLFMAWVFLFLDQPYQRRHFFFLCKNKKKISKNWEFWTQVRMTMLVFSTFASDNGVFQAGLGLTVILAVLASQSFKKPYKDERSNLLEIFCLLVNISMLFLGIVASIGSLESKSMAGGAQMFGEFCFLAALLGCVRTMVGECADRSRLNASKQGASGDMGAKRSKHEEKEDNCLIDFVSQVMDIVIPKTRDGDAIFPVSVIPHFWGTAVVTSGSRILSKFTPKRGDKDGDLSGKIILLDIDLPEDAAHTIRVNRAALSKENRYKAIKLDPNDPSEIHMSKQFEKRTPVDGKLVAVYCLNITKKFPREEIKMLLFSHAILKRNLSKMQRKCRRTKSSYLALPPSHKPVAPPFPRPAVAALPR